MQMATHLHAVQEDFAMHESSEGDGDGTSLTEGISWYLRLFLAFVFCTPHKSECSAVACTSMLIHLEWAAGLKSTFKQMALQQPDTSSAAYVPVQQHPATQCNWAMVPVSPQVWPDCACCAWHLPAHHTEAVPLLAPAC